MFRLVHVAFIVLVIGCAKSESKSTTLEAIVLASAPNDSFRGTTDHVRETVNLYSDHTEAASSYDTSDVDLYADQMAQAMNGGLRPNIKCGHRARLVMKILEAAGYRTRLVNLLTDRSGYLDGHTFLEALNPEGDTWEVVDPDLNVYYELNGRRLSVFELVELSPEDFKPCRAQVCSWSLENTNLVEGAFTVPNMKVDNFYSVALIHPGDYSLPKTSEAPSMLINTARFTDHAWDRLGGKTAAQYYVLDKNGALEFL